MQCNGETNSGCFPSGKPSSQSTALPRFPPPPPPYPPHPSPPPPPNPHPPTSIPLCAMFSCFHTTGSEAHPRPTDGYGIFYVCTSVGACRTTHEMAVMQAQPSHAQRVDWKGQEQNCSSPCPATRGSNPGPADWNSDSLY